MKLSLKSEWPQLLILAVPFCVVALLWDSLPNWVPIHWNAQGQVDGYARKTFGTLVVPVTNVVVALLMGLVSLVDPRLARHDPEMRASLWRTIKILRLCITGFLAVVSLGMLAAAMKWFADAQFNSMIYVGISLLYIFLGNFMGKLRPNYFVGIRTPWTLESKEVWTRTHRVGGRLMVVCGLLMLMLSFVIPPEKFVFLVVLPTGIGLAAFSLVYSYIIYRKIKLNTPPIIST